MADDDEMQLVVELLSGKTLKASMTYGNAKRVRETVKEAFQQAHPAGSLMMPTGEVVRFAAIAYVSITKPTQWSPGEPRSPFMTKLGRSPD